MMCEVILLFLQRFCMHPRKCRTPGANAIEKFTPSLGIPYLGVETPKWELGVRSWEPFVTPKSGLLNF